jgi:hypothetical protein
MCRLQTDIIGCTGECCMPEQISSTLTPTACDSPCLALDEAACTSDARCYVARDRTAFYTGAVEFIGCFPATSMPSSLSCGLRAADTCAYGGTCAGLYTQSGFVECVDESQIAGTCTGAVTCTTTAPTCPGDRTPGVANGCYTGACIPNDLCT